MIDKSNWEFDYPLPITEPKLPTKESMKERENGNYNDYYFCYRCNTTTQVG